MASFTEAHQNPKEQLWDEIDDIHAGMLGLAGMHMRPMAPFADREGQTVWFYTRRDSELVRSLDHESHAHFCVVGKNHDYHACVAGTLSATHDRATIDKYWNSVVAAWYEGGKDDPNLVMLALKLTDGEIWASTDSTLKFGWEIAKANLDPEKMPDVGVHQKVSFSGPDLAAGI